MKVEEFESLNDYYHFDLDFSWAGPLLGAQLNYYGIKWKTYVNLIAQYVRAKLHLDVLDEHATARKQGWLYSGEVGFDYFYNCPWFAGGKIEYKFSNFNSSRDSLKWDSVRAAVSLGYIF